MNIKIVLPLFFYNMPLVKSTIGVLASRMQHGPDTLDKVATSYCDCIAAANGLPIILPNISMFADEYLSAIDGLILIGGSNDIDPAFYKEENVASRECLGEKDALEIQFVYSCLRLHKPLLGICRGMQILNVALGGSLVQHLPSSKLHLQPEKQESLIHSLHICHSSIFTDGDMMTNSIHHQAVNSIGKDLRITGRSEDGTIEMIEHIDAPIIGVQWHPECLPESKETRILFHWLVTTSGYDCKTPSLSHPFL